MEIIALLKEIAGFGSLGVFLSLFVLLYLRERKELNKERRAHDQTRDKYVATALSFKDLFHKVMDTMRIVGNENSVDFEDCKHRLDNLEQKIDAVFKKATDTNKQVKKKLEE